MKLLLDTIINKQNNHQIPIWLMRQAGRYLPEYREIRTKVTNFLDLCYNPKLAAQVTLQPIARFDFDAAIIFSDILVIADSLSDSVRFVENHGPQLDIINDETDLKKLKILTNCSKLAKTYETINLVKSALATNKTLIGFAGAPWTVAAYMLEGSSKNDFQLAKQKIFNKKSLVIQLIDIITELTIIYLRNQIIAGADVVQIFDSWAGILSSNEYDEFVIAPTVKIVQALKKDFPNVPIIGFPRNSFFNYERYVSVTKIDCLSVDFSLPLAQVQQLQNKVVIQGNLDPSILLADDQSFIAQKIDEIVEKLGNKPFIFNLGHGILPQTPIKNVEFLLKKVRKN